MGATRNKFSPEFRDGAVRMVEEHRGDYAAGEDDFHHRQQPKGAVPARQEPAPAQVGVKREVRVSQPNALWVVDLSHVHTWAGARL